MIATSRLASAGAPGEVQMAPLGGSILLAVLVGILFAAGTYLLLQRALTRIVIGLGLLTHGANVLLLSAGGRAGPAPFVTGASDTTSTNVVDPLPQAMALTAIVISFSVTALLIALAYRSMVLVHDDDVQNDPEDRRVLQTEHSTDRITRAELRERAP